MKLHLVEEIMLLTLHDDGGKFTDVKDWPLRCALAGAVLMDLVLEGRAAAEPESLRILDSAPLDAPLLDPALAEMAADDQARTPRHWVDHFARQADRLRTEALESLVARGILRHDSGLFHWAHGSRRYPVADYTEEVEVKLRLWRVLLEDEEPGPRDIALIHVAHACHILQQFLRHALLQRAAKRIEEVCHLDEAGAAVLDAVMDSEVAAGPTHGQPISTGLKFVEDLRAATRHDFRWLTRRYMEYGPVFRLRLPHRDETCMAGPEANRFMMRHGTDYLWTHEEWGTFCRPLGGSKFLLSMSGAEHKRLRHAMKPGLSRHFALDRASDMVEATRCRIAEWPMGEPLPASRTFSRLVAAQQRLMLAGLPPDGREDDIIDFIDETLSIYVGHWQSERHAKSEKFQRACRHMKDLIARSIEHYRSEGNDARSHCAGGLIALHDEDRVFMSEADLPTAMAGMFVGGIDTVAGTLAFMLHALLEDPELMARATAEADELLADGLPDPADVARLDVLHRTMMESLRMYPPLFCLARSVANAFDFGGYRLPVGEHVKVATAVPHYLPEFYPDPYKFDIDRYLPERMEHAHPGVYVPFGLGAHACLGSGLANIQVPLIMATLLHECELERGPHGGRELKFNSVPTLRPDDSFAFRIRRRR